MPPFGIKFEEFYLFLSQILKTMAQILKTMAQILKTLAQVLESSCSGSKSGNLFGHIFEAFGGHGAEKVEKKRNLGKAQEKERQNRETV